MKAKDKHHSKTYEKGTTHTDFSQNNIGTLGHISYARKEGKGSFKKISEFVAKGHGPNIEGIGENEEDHSTRL